MIYTIVYINGKDNAKLTGNHTDMKLLMLTLPFMVSDQVTLLLRR